MTQTENEETVYSDEEDELQEDDDPKVFKIRNRIPGATAANLTLAELLQMLHDGDIDLCPPYQRDDVWPKPKKMALIDSIWSGIYIPPILFFMNDEGVRVCIDGKQRLTSIDRFLTGQIPHKDPVTKKLWWFTTSEQSKTTRLEIPESARKEFLQRTVTCVEYRNLTPATEREIFNRVQLGSPLTSAEKLQAVNSATAAWLGALEQRFLLIKGGLLELIDLDTGRARAYQNLANLAYTCEGLPNEERFATSGKISQWVATSPAPSKQLKRTVEDSLQTFISIAADKAHNQAFRTIDKKVAPVEFIFIGVLLHMLRNQTKHAKGLAIHNFRIAVREQFTDVRNNSRTVKTLWRYVEQLAEDPLSPVEIEEEVPLPPKPKATPKGKGKGPAKKRSADEVDNSPAGPSTPKARRPRVS
ncbi:hypothetical protein D9611_002455 [Ephemerocybe angulata]|uniref:GmrSD restriction endonucleases N-terminal domain-containing protein n=1 Tax=Ephemerocybe angulata TaxID=980116 RepID=A0A8H5C2S6_9AGAR|nr:hypothetical protein D9611_002455 [Tulosesus angulatus]